MLAFTMALIDVAARAAALPDAGADGHRSDLVAVCARLDGAVRAAEEVTALLAARVGARTTEAVPEARAAAALEEQMTALTGAGRLLRGFVQDFGAVDGDLYARASALVGSGVNVLDSLADVVGQGRLPLGPSGDEIAGLAWRSRGPDTASRLSRQSRMVAGARERWRRAAPPVRGEWGPLHRDEAARYLRLCCTRESLADGRGALAALRAGLGESS
ncbi:hypothetical protein NI17_001200 [Thermobifida halotolerans]|uniref:Uncharacterized protein n=1 Tax=Thermobifida halotolerans TaxID=483545 RepID=A0A399G0T4_9ACTN|nr:hypothetical protein [Thermobifida halotolerans]UOE19913.1 hypothetical protein NI17_001200 [Thermobifida halotolerans]